MDGRAYVLESKSCGYDRADSAAQLDVCGFDFHEIDLNWGQSTDNDFVDHYNVYRSTSSNFAPSTSNLVGNTNQLFYQDTGLLANTINYYYVLAVDQNGNLSAASNEATAATGANSQNLIPAHISNISLSLGSSSATCTVTVVNGRGRLSPAWKCLATGTRQPEKSGPGTQARAGHTARRQKIR